MEENIIKSHHNNLSKELLTIEEIPPKPDRNKRHNFKRLYTFNENRKSLYSIKKLNISPKMERLFTIKKDSLITSPNKNRRNKTSSNIELESYMTNYNKNKKKYYNNSPAVSTTENEVNNTNYKSLKIEKRTPFKLNDKINEIYTMYQKTYETNNIENLSRNKDKRFFNSVTNTNFLKKKKIENNLFIPKTIDRELNYKIQKKYSNLTEIKTKTNKKKNPMMNSLKMVRNHNFFNNDLRKLKSEKNLKINTCLTEGNYNRRGSAINDPNLHKKIIELIKELNSKKSSEYYILKREENAEKQNKKILINKAKGRGKLVSLLNNKSENKKEFESLNYYSRKKIQKGQNPMLIRKPTNNIEMNNLLINSFGAGYNHNEYSKKMFNLNETFFALIEKMKQRRAEIDIAKFEKEKNKYIKKGFQKQNYEVYFQKNNRDKWEKKFMHDQYHYKIPEKEFKQFKRAKQNEMRKQIAKDSLKLSELLTNMDAEQYELPDAMTKFFKSTKNSISLKNVKRIYRVQKILKNIEDEEQTGKIIFDANKLKKEQNKIESQMINAFGRSGKPRFVKTIFKPRTIRKYKGISGNYFGLPA